MDNLNLNDELKQEPSAPAVQPDTANANGMSGGVGKKDNAAKIALITVGAVVLAVVFFLVGWLGRYFSLDPRARELIWLIDTVNGQYYQDVSEDEWDKLYDQFYDMVLPDRFCTYYSPEEYEDLLRESEGSNRDTGLAAIDEGDSLRVYRAVGNSPAALAGIRSGMYIYRFGTSAENLQEGDRNAMYSLAGQIKDALYLECGFSPEDKALYCVTSSEYLASYCSYSDSGTSFDFLGEKELVLTDTGNAMEGLDAETAYIRIAQFDGNADWEFTELLKKMHERGRTNLVIDLRQNGGGYLSVFRSMAAHLLRSANDDKPIVATATFGNGGETVFRADGNDFTEYFSADSRITLLADENTASASECLIGALIDYGTSAYTDVYLRKSGTDEAHSYGKGVMQSAFVSPSGGAVRLTSAEIFWPSGHSIHETGVRESDGAIGISAPRLPGETDEMLSQVFARICS